jgi:hypothetical protein
MKKLLIWTGVLLITSALSFVGGTYIGRKNTISLLSESVEMANAHVTLSHYSLYRDIAKEIKARRYDDAQCLAELSASNMLDGLKECMGNLSCKQSLEKQAHEFAPEVLGEIPMPIKYRTNCF